MNTKTGGVGKADRPNQKCLTDFTEFKLINGQKAYLSAIPDLGDRSIVSYVLGQSKNKLDNISSTQSMSSVIRYIDNELMEGFGKIIKFEMYYLHKFHTYEELKQAIGAYIEFYNMRRLQKN